MAPLSNNSTSPSKMMLLILILTFSQLLQAAPSDVQPANQPPASQQQNPLEGKQPGGDVVQAGNQQQAAPIASTPQKLPNINIYINRNEIKKLLGIDSRINYVTNGNIDTYPFGFTIPLGYNQTDMIFTWQNLGQTNVNYSISLVIGNIKAVEAPLINITRSGLIPTHEQVFKITLPCSGKMSVEVDFQVLINITGYLSESAEEELSSDGEQLPANSGADEPPPSATGSQMQSDQAPERGRLVSHTLVLNRKKICTVHPVPVPVQPPARNQVQVQTRQPSTTAAPQANPTSGPVWQSATQNAPPSPITTSSSTSTSRPRTEAPTSVDQQTFANDYSSEPAARNPFPGSLESADFADESTKLLPSLLSFIPPTPASRRQLANSSPDLQSQQAIGAYAGWPRTNKLSGAKLPPSLLAGNEIDAGRASYQQQQQQNQQVAGSNNPLVFTLIGLSLLISVALIVVAILGSSSSSGSQMKRSPLDNLSSFTRGILRRNFESAASQMVASKCPETVVGAGAVISSLRAGPKSSQASSISGLSAISGGPFASVGGAGGANNHGNKSCYKPTCAANGYYTTSGASQHQYHYSTGTHHYQQPPTADLLGTGYQCQQQQQVPVVPPPQYPVHHIAAGNLSQTTRLIWNNGNGSSPDGFTVEQQSYMPLSNAARSDTGSVYQTIY